MPLRTIFEVQSGDWLSSTAWYPARGSMGKWSNAAWHGAWHVLAGRSDLQNVEHTSEKWSRLKDRNSVFTILKASTLVKFVVLLFVVSCVSAHDSDPLPDSVLETLKQQEGFSATVYHDSRGFLTIGYGTNLHKGITEKEAALLLEERLRDVQKLLTREWPPFESMPHKIQAVLLNMAYQLGVHGLLHFEEMLGALLVGQYERAAQHALNSKWAEETPTRVQNVIDTFLLHAN